MAKDAMDQVQRFARLIEEARRDERRKFAQELLKLIEDPTVRKSQKSGLWQAATLADPSIREGFSE